MATNNGIRQPRVEMVYDRDCPNVEDCRAAIRTALLGAGASASWNEWDRDDEKTPFAYRAFGSPTVLVNGRDINHDINRGMDGTPEAERDGDATDGNSCRVYTDADSGRLCGTPSVQRIAKAIAEASCLSAVIASDKLCASAPSPGMSPGVIRGDACC